MIISLYFLFYNIQFKKICQLSIKTVKEKFGTISRDERFNKAVTGLLLLLFSARLYQNTGNFYVSAFPLLIWVIAAAFGELKKNKESWKAFLWFIPFLLWNLISVLWSDHPGYSLQRAVFAVFITAGFLSAGYLFRDYLKEKFTFHYIILIPLILLSLFSMLSGIPGNSWSGGNGLGFMGFASHQNTLAAAVIFTLPVLFYPFTERVRISPGKNRLLIINALLLTGALYILISSHSRASVLAFLIFFILFALISLKKGSLIYVVPALFFIGAVVMFSPLGKKIEDYAYKSAPSVLSTRQEMIKASIDGAKLGGLTGLGYGISHRDTSIVLAGDHERNGIFVREKGISSLGIVEETGITGLILFLIIYIPLIRRVKQSYNFTTRQKLFILSVFLMYSVHAQFEAWWIGAGSMFYQIHFFTIGYLIKNS